MTFQKPDTGYWERKFMSYMHDPLDKILQIKGHEERAALFLEKYGLQKPNEEFWKKADVIAAGSERGQVPSYSPDENKNGAIDFLESPVITHPTSKACLKISFTDSKPEIINDALLKFIEENIGIKAGSGGYSDEFKGDNARFAIARFFYTHLALRFKLAENNVGGLGALWHRIPADTRFPDHSIWQHNALCSALNSCMELASDAQIGMMIFSITPVQPFITKARKLRDYWTGSVLLSWLAFEGIRWVMENLGPDHILYPSLIDQPLVNEYLQKMWKVKKVNFINTRNDIASLPNKFLFLIPMDMAESIATGIKAHIRKAWQGLYLNCCDYLCHKLDGLTQDDGDFIKKLFSRQNENFWEMQWASARLVAKHDKDDVSRLLPKNSFASQFELLNAFNETIKDKPYQNSGQGTLYSVSHSLVQSALAATKTRKSVKRREEPGEKCHLCGEFEVLHAKEYSGDIAAEEYKQNIRNFWKTVKKAWDGEEGNQFSYDFNENERLCSICTIKRIAYKVLESNKEHILHKTFSNKKGYPSTTEFALHSYYKRNKIQDEDEKKKEAQKIHDRTEDGVNNRDRYYAILLMDGDKMGKLVNGETLASTWESIMHPEIVKRLNGSSYDKKYYDNWQIIYKKYPKRLLTPAIHAAISESLGDFSIYGVASIINNHQGKLIYAGGDDVCAVLPVYEAFDAANEIQGYYKSAFKLIQQDGYSRDVSNPWQPSTGKLSINLGKGSGISISAAILICHHKESLSQMIANAQVLLKNKAKEEAGRNACAIELRKRSGGSRYFVRKWDDDVWNSFREVGDAIEDKRKVQVSSSLVYRLENFRDGIKAILEHEKYKSMLTKFISKQLERSSVGNNKEGVAEKMTDIVVEIGKEGKRYFKPEGLIVAAFMARGGEDDE